MENSDVRKKLTKSERKNAAMTTVSQIKNQKK